MWRPGARAATPLIARLFASVALAVKITPDGVPPMRRATFARAPSSDARVYLDYAGFSPVDPRVVAVMRPFLEGPRGRSRRSPGRRAAPPLRGRYRAMRTKKRKTVP